MKSLIIKKAKLYGVIGFVLNVITHFIHGSAWAAVINVAALLAMLFDIGRTITNRPARKKYIIYTSIFVGQGFAIYLISRLLSVSLENSWLSVMGMGVMFLTICVLLFDVARFVRRTSEPTGCLLYAAAILLVVIAAVVNIVFFVGGAG